MSRLVGFYSIHQLTWNTEIRHFHCPRNIPGTSQPNNENRIRSRLHHCCASRSFSPWQKKVAEAFQRVGRSPAGVFSVWGVKLPASASETCLGGMRAGGRAPLILSGERYGSCLHRTSRWRSGPAHLYKKFTLMLVGGIYGDSLCLCNKFRRNITQRLI